MSEIKHITVKNLDEISEETLNELSNGKGEDTDEQ